jgi:Protein of unknown function (DUF2786)
VGKRNKERRAASRRRKAHSGRLSGAGRARVGDSGSVEDGLRAAASAVSYGDVGAARACADELLGNPSPASATRAVQAAQTVVHEAIRQAWQRGWQPLDLDAVTRRRQSGEHVATLAAAIVTEATAYAPGTLEPRWRDQLDVVGADLQAGPQRPGEAWLLPTGRGLHEAISLAVELVALVWMLPAIATLLPLPGTARPAARHRALDDADRRQLTRIRALLAKAESSEFPDEAEALSAKAQQLMSRHAIERVMLEASQDGAPQGSTARRMWLDAPYAGAKSLLVASVASANSCQAVWSEDLGFITVVGDPSDLASVEMLATSLLVQANRAMLAAGRIVDRRGTSRTRSFRQSFLVSYATRIRQRLIEASEAEVTEASRARGEATLLPVLAARVERAEAATREIFPRLTSRSVAVSSSEGWAAGHAAADAAVFETHRQVGTQRPA